MTTPEEEIEVFSLTEDERPTAAAPAADHFRPVVAAAAVVGALALAVTAWATMQRLSVERRQACLTEAQITAFLPSGNVEQADLERRVRTTLDECGVDLPD